MPAASSPRKVDDLGRPTLGWDMIAWYETMLVHGPGDVQGQSIELDDELVRFILRCYAHDLHGRRLYDLALLSRSKGRAKSELAGMVVCGEGLGPVRFAGWDADGEIVGKPVTYPFIRLLATEEGQTGNTYKHVTYMLTEGEVAREYPGIELGRSAETSSRVILPDGGEIRPSTSGAASKDGGLESFAVGDEVHLYITRETRDMHDTVEANTGKRRDADPWMLDTSTMYGVGEDSIAERLHADAKGDPRILLDHRQGLPVADLMDTEALIASLKHTYGPFAVNMDLTKIASKVQRQGKRNEAMARRLWLNEEWAGTDNFVDPRLWDIEARPYGLELGDAVALGFDGSESEDSTVLHACRLADNHLVTLGCWEKTGDGWQVPRMEVMLELHKAFTNYRVAVAIFDPHDWRAEIALLARTYGEDRVLEFPTNKDTRFGPACEVFRLDVATRRLTHDGDARVDRHVKNALSRTTTSGTVIRKPHGVLLKVDGAVSAVLARWGAHTAPAPPEPKPEPRIRYLER